MRAYALLGLFWNIIEPCYFDFGPYQAGETQPQLEHVCDSPQDLVWIHVMNQKLRNWQNPAICCNQTSQAVDPFKGAPLHSHHTQGMPRLPSTDVNSHYEPRIWIKTNNGFKRTVRSSPPLV